MLSHTKGHVGHQQPTVGDGQGRLYCTYCLWWLAGLHPRGPEATLGTFLVVMTGVTTGNQWVGAKRLPNTPQGTAWPTVKNNLVKRPGVPLWSLLYEVDTFPGSSHPPENKRKPGTLASGVGGPGAGLVTAAFDKVSPALQDRQPQGRRSCFPTALGQESVPHKCLMLVTSRGHQRLTGSQDRSWKGLSDQGCEKGSRQTQQAWGSPYSQDKVRPFSWEI